MTTTTDEELKESPDPKLLRVMEKRGFERREAWLFKPHASDGPPVDNAERAKKKAAERQAAKAARDANDNWARCYAKAPNDDDARMIVSAVAKAIAAPEVRMAIRLALANPRAAFVGDKVCKLSGIRAIVTRKLVGAVEMPKPLEESSGSSSS